jgi:hypothetical protein
MMSFQAQKQEVNSQNQEMQKRLKELETMILQKFATNYGNTSKISQN